MDARPISIFLLDDNAALADAMARYFRDRADLRWAGSTTDPAELEDAVAALKPDVVLMDHDMPGLNPPAKIAAMHATFPYLKVLVLSGYCRAPQVRAVMQAGAWGYLTKDMDPADIALSVQLAHSGEFVISPAAEQAMGASGAE